MMMWGTTTNIVMMVSSAILGFFALKKYVKEPVNFEHTLYWGLSFSILATGLLMDELRLVTSSMPAVMVSISMWLNAYAVLTATKNMHPKYVKKYRVVVWGILVLILPAVHIYSFLIGKSLVRVILVVLTLVFLAPVRWERIDLFIVYSLMLLSKISGMLCVVLNRNTFLYDFRNGLMTVSMLYLTWYVYKLIDGREHL